MTAKKQPPAEGLLERISVKWLLIGLGALFVLLNDGAQVWERITNWQGAPAKAAAEKAAAETKAAAEKAAADLKEHQKDDDARLVNIQKSIAVSSYNADVGRAWVYSGLTNVQSSVAALALQICRNDAKKLDCRAVEDASTSARQDAIEAKKQAGEITAKKP